MSEGSQIRPGGRGKSNLTAGSQMRPRVVGIEVGWLFSKHHKIIQFLNYTHLQL